MAAGAEGASLSVPKTTTKAAKKTPTPRKNLYTSTKLAGTTHVEVKARMERTDEEGDHE